MIMILITNLWTRASSVNIETQKYPHYFIKSNCGRF